MTTRDHLVYHLQNLFAFQRDFIPLLMEMEHLSAHRRLCELLHAEWEGMRIEQETLERALNLLGARYKQEHSALVPGWKEAMQRFKHQMNPSQEQLELQAAADVIKSQHLAIGAYQGDIELARAIGESDVALLLDENLQREQQRLSAMLALLPRLIGGISQGESRQAA